MKRRWEADSSDLRREQPLVDAVLRSLCALENRLMTANRLAGLTAFCICRRESKPTPPASSAGPGGIEQ